MWYRNDYHDGTLPPSKLHEDPEGIIIKDVEDYPFNWLPYSEDEYEDEEDLIEFLQGTEVLTPKKLKEDIMKSIGNCFDTHFWKIRL